MDRSWMYTARRPDPLYIGEINKFVKQAVTHAEGEGETEIYCPCKDCKNQKLWRDAAVIKSHLITKGFVEGYTRWTKHGENIVIDAQVDSAEGDDHFGPSAAQSPNIDEDMDVENNFDVEELLSHVEPQVLLRAGTTRGLDNFAALQKASKDPLYEESKGCGKEFTLLRTVLELMKLKATHGWSDVSFTNLLEVLSDVLPKPNLLPTSTYLAKKLISPLSLGVQKIHACPNHCILYRKEYEHAVRCPICNRSRYKRTEYPEADTTDGGKKSKTKGRKRKKTPTVDDGNDTKIPSLVMWYLPVIDRIRRLFANPRDAELMTWHAERGDGKIRHPADASQWKRFNSVHPEFAGEKRNIRFALSTDGMNPFGQMRNPHSTWPVILSMYNIPSWLCHKRKYLLLTCLISGPKEPGNDIDTFLEPLFEDMQKLWDEGVRMWDECRRQYFTLHAIIFTTISDSPALRCLSGQVKGKAACIVCVDKTKSTYLPATKKLVYMRHRRFLPRGHRYRGMLRHFDGTFEKDTAERRCIGSVVFEMVRNIKVILGKKKGVRKEAPTTPFKKQSIFYRFFSYWKELEVPHAIDWMHIGKGVFDNTSGLFLDVPGKTMDGLKARRDLVELNIRPELHPVEKPNGKYYLPPAAYTLTREEKMAFCNCLHGIKVPTGFCSNISNLVNMQELKISGYNTHDCHTLLSVFLPIAIRAIKSGWVKLAVTRLCYIFSMVSKKVISEEELVGLRIHVQETMSMLEMVFPPSYFDTLEHFMVHIVDQISALGPVYLHNMFPFERFMFVLKKFVRTHAHPEGSMIEGYTTEEIVECCADYIKDGTSIGLPVSRHEGRLSGKGTKGRKSFMDHEYKRVDHAHFTVLQNTEMMVPYFEKHVNEVARNNPDFSEEEILKEHRRSFTTWFMNQELPSGDSVEEETLRRLASRPKRSVVTFQAYDISGFTFYTKDKDKKSKCQNSGVRVQAPDGSGEMASYFGFIEEIWELDYGGNLQIPMFLCKWVKHPDGVEVDDYGLTIVNLDNVGHKDEPWILARTVEQVFYVLDPKDNKKYIVVPGKQRIVGVDNVEDPDQYNQYVEMPFMIDPSKFKVIEGQLTYTPGMPYVRTDIPGKTVQG